MVVSEFRCFIRTCWRKQSRPVDVWQRNVSYPSLSCNCSHNEHVYFVFRLHTLQYPCFNCVVVFTCALCLFYVGVRCIPRPEGTEPSLASKQTCESSSSSATLTICLLLQTNIRPCVLSISSSERRK